jgi:hypothetical protein
MCRAKGRSMSGASSRSPCLAASMFREVLMAFCYLWGAKNVTEIQTGFFARMGPSCYPHRMDREMLRQYLQQTEKHLAASDKLVTDQRALIARLEERGYDTAKARTALAHLEEMRKLHIADRDRLSRALRELGE